MPEMSQRSSVLSQHQVSTLFLSFTPRLRLYPWHLLFSISRNGCSLANLYSKLENYDSTLLLLILDTKRTAFGALLSPPNIKLQGKKYSGTPETFLFTFSPKLRKFAASGENNYFIQCMPDGLSIGGWRAGIWIDNNLEKGTTDVSPTFENTALTDNNFVIKEMECWALSDMEMESGYNTAVPIYHQFSSSLLASKKPEIEVGGVRCGRRSRKYQPTWVPEKGGAVYDNKRIFSLGEDEEDEGLEDEYEVDQDTTPTSSRGWSSMYY
ncbi:TLD domain-containing protein 2 [Eurytemora carolleeae]|uniref:TLD domain-containing protein 2 n=1 Tax=Eurytemora carolleeae TaxID=1294199 RepID=UPI000C79527B|nr:TLD domain-containing protein 2 [Eurytemora carolleeae]|eukprot:XP_023344494.1 TLD domain-containing protein 2-like [Eurytemora affinis]